MKVIQLPPGTGKSVMALHQAILQKCPLVVYDERSREKILEFTNQMAVCVKCELMSKDVKNLKIMTFEEFMHQVRAGKTANKEFVFDDIDLMLKDLFKVNPSKITVTTN